MRFQNIAMAAAVSLGVVSSATVTPPRDYDLPPDLVMFNHSNLTDLGDYFNSTNFHTKYVLSNRSPNVLGGGGLVSSAVGPHGFMAKTTFNFTSDNMVSATQPETDLPGSNSRTAIEQYPFAKVGGINCIVSPSGPVTESDCYANAVIFDGHVGYDYEHQGLAVQFQVKKTGAYNKCMAMDYLDPSINTVGISDNSYGFGMMAVDAKTTSTGYVPEITNAPAYLNRYIQPNYSYVNVRSEGKQSFIIPSGMSITGTRVRCGWTVLKKNQFLTFAIKNTGTEAYFGTGRTNLTVGDKMMSFTFGFGGVFDFNGKKLAQGYGYPLYVQREHYDFNDIRSLYLNNSPCAKDFCAFNSTGGYGSNEHDCVFSWAPQATRVIGVQNLFNNDTTTSVEQYGPTYQEHHDFMSVIFGGPTAADQNMLGAAGLYKPTEINAILSNSVNWQAYTGNFFYPEITQAAHGSGSSGSHYGLVNGSTAETKLGTVHMTLDSYTLLMGVIPRHEKPKQVFTTEFNYNDSIIPPVYPVSIGGDASKILGNLSPANALWTSQTPFACIPTEKPTLPTALLGGSVYAWGGDLLYDPRIKSGFYDPTLIPFILGPTGPVENPNAPTTYWQDYDHVRYCVYGAHGPAYTTGTITFTVNIQKVQAALDVTKWGASLAITAYRQSYLSNHSNEIPQSNYASTFPIGSPLFDKANRDVEVAASMHSYEQIVPLDDSTEESVNLEVTVGTGERGMFDSARLMIACVDRASRTPGTPVGLTADYEHFCEAPGEIPGTYMSPKFSIKARFTPMRVKEADKSINDDLYQKDRLNCNGKLIAGSNSPVAHTIVTNSTAVADPGAGCKVANGSVTGSGKSSNKCLSTLPTWNAGIISDPSIAGTIKTATDSHVWNHNIIDSTTKEPFVTAIYHARLYTLAKIYGGAKLSLFTLNGSKLLREDTHDLNTLKATNTSITHMNKSTTGLAAVSVPLFAGDISGNQPDVVDRLPPTAQIMPALFYEFTSASASEYIKQLHVAVAIDDGSSRNIVLVAAMGVTMLVAALF